MSIYRKIKRRGAIKPPLSLADKTIYRLIILLGILSALLVLVYADAAERIGRSEENVIAYSGSASVVWSLPISLALAFSLSIPAGIALKLKQPIFGNKKFKPRPFDSTIKTFPLFSHEFRSNLSEKSKRSAKITIVSVTLLLVLCFAISFFGIYPRNVLRADGSIASYDFQNQLKDEYNVKDIRQLKISIYHKVKRPYKYTINLEFICENKSYHFSEKSFAPMGLSEKNHAEIFEMMLRIKTLVGIEKCIVNDKKLEDMIYYDDFSPREEELVRKLFES